MLVSEPTGHLLAPFFELAPGGAYAVGMRKTEQPTFVLQGEREGDSVFMLRPESVKRPMIGRVAEL